MIKENKICKLEQLNLLLSKSLILYGAAERAKTIVKYSRFYSNENKIREIVVSDLKGNPNSLLSINVTSISELSQEEINMPFLICVSDTFWKEIEECLIKIGVKEIYYLDDELFQIMYDMFCAINDRVKKIQNRMVRLIKKPNVNYMIFNILNHCNLRCKGCNHFACIADEYFVSVDSLQRDMEFISKVMEGDYITKIAIMGGEPLLHPDLLAILQMTRQYFPHAIIRLTSNGILMNRQSDEFWTCLKNNDITIVNTKYPLQVDYEAIRKRAEDNSIKYQFFEGTEDRKMLYKHIVDPDGRVDPVQAFLNCPIEDTIAFVMEGKLYSCPFSCMSHIIFNQKFQQNLRMTKDDYLCINEIKDKQEIFEFLATPKYYCRYCGGAGKSFEWCRTNGEISEWVADE